MLHWQGSTPVSGYFDDIYYSAEDGLAESRYVFLSRNGLPERLMGQEDFTIAETGFGTGLNFLALWHLWDALPEPKPRLHYLTTERYPLSAADAATAHTHWPDLKAYSAELTAHWPDAIPGCHCRLLAGGNILLEIWHGDANHTLASLLPARASTVNAWFLDGFAPSKNPDLWQDGLFHTLHQLSRPGATLATFTAAGQVRRGLAHAGFNVQKTRGFGRKRDMLVAEKPRTPEAAPAIHPHRPPSVVIGGGLAGVASAFALAQQGREVTLLDASPTLASGASGNPAAAFTPYYTADWSARGSYYAGAFSTSRHLLHWLMARGHPLEAGFTGALMLGEDEDSRHHRLWQKAGLPTTILQKLTAQQASEQAGVPLPTGGFYYPQAGWLSMASVARALLAEAGDRVEYFPNSFVQSLAHDAQDWRVQVQGQCHALHTRQLVLANGRDAARLVPELGLRLEAVRGQLIRFPAPPTLQSLKLVLHGQGYLTPPHAGQMVYGSTFVRHDEGLDARAEDTQKLLKDLAELLPMLSASERAAMAEGCTPWVGQRVATPQRLPLTGPAITPDGTPIPGLSLNLAHGSRGSLTALAGAF